jgi:hypothetical protein
MRMRATNISGRESAMLSVSSSRQVAEKRPIRTIDAHDLFADTNAASVGDVELSHAELQQMRCELPMRSTNTVSPSPC